MDLVSKLQSNHDLTDAEFLALLSDDSFDEALCKAADRVRREVYGDEVFLRGLIEFSNYCKNDCFYCGIRCKNANVERYRLSTEEILECCDTGHKLGFRTFVLQVRTAICFGMKRRPMSITGNSIPIIYLYLTGNSACMI